MMGFLWPPPPPLIFHIYIPWGKTYPLVPSSRSLVKVRYQGQFSKKNGYCGGIRVSQTHLILLDLSEMINFRFFQTERVCR